MKKTLEILCICCLLFASAPVAAVGGEGWYRVTEDGVGFYSSPSSSAQSPLFTLEKSYYIYADSYVGGFLDVTLFDNTGGFAKISGYVKASEVVSVSEAPALPVYPTETLTVVSSGTVIKSRPDLDAADVSVAVGGRAVYYYGASADGEWYYVRYDNDFGYIKADRLSALDIPAHPTPLETVNETPEPTPDENAPEPSPQDTSSAEIILIVLICVPAVVIVFLLFMPQKNGKNKKPRPPRPKYMSDNDTFDDLDLL